MLPDEKISIDIKYLNLTFQDMFTAFKERLRQEKNNYGKEENAQEPNEKDVGEESFERLNQSENDQISKAKVKSAAE